MRTFKGLLFSALGSALILTSCGDSTSNEESAQVDTPVQKTPITLADVGSSPEYPDAQLSFGAVTTAKQGDDSTKITFNFNVKNYELKNQTADAGGKMCNNSDQGQHIHFILDNKPYVALYEPKHEVTVANNSEHTLLVFLSRSYHESVKTKGAAALYTFKINKDGKLEKTPEPATPMVFYSRPKGDYVGTKNTENLLFDFYVWNGSLSDSMQVKAEIKTPDGDTTIMVNNWKSQFLKGMPMGDNEIKLTLVDKSGNKIDGPETEVSRKFKLAADEPMVQ